MKNKLSYIAILFSFTLLFTNFYPGIVVFAEQEDSIENELEESSSDVLTNESEIIDQFEPAETSVDEETEESVQENSVILQEEVTGDIEENLIEREVEETQLNAEEISEEDTDLEEVYDREALHNYAMSIENKSSTEVRTSSTSAWPFSNYPANVRTFISAHAERAKSNANAAGLYPSVMIAQAILESGWGSSKLSLPPYHQLFGIKGNNFSGETITVPTKEWIVDKNHKDGGYYITVNASFRVYPSYDAAFKDQAKFLTVNTRYKNVFRNQAKTYKEATRALQSAGYATDPEYANKLNSLIERWELYRLDGGINYQTHVQTIGNTSTVRNGQTSGTVGSKLRLESIKLNLEDLPNSGIEYRTHVQTYGWQSWKSNGQLSGTTGEAKRLEAIQIRLTGTAATQYDVYYRVHAEHFGWLDWAKNGEQAGTEGYRYRMEAVEVKLVSKGQSVGGSTSSPFRSAPSLVGVSTHVQSDGWQEHVRNSKFSGTIGEAKRLEGIKLRLENQEYNGSIRYRTHVQTYGWQDWKSNDQTSGTYGEAKRLEAIQIELTSEMAKQYDVYYRTYIQSYGWLGWSKNGQESGSEGLSKRLEAIQVQLVKKGNPAPGSTSNNYMR